MKTAIIGGGITGLAAAYYLQKEIMTNSLDMEYHLFEKEERLGGKIKTDYYNGFVIEQGPDSFLARKESASILAKEVGLEEELITNNASGAYILKGRSLHPIPEGSVMGIPTKLGPFLTTGLFSIRGKLRAAADFILPRSKSDSDQGLGVFFRRRLGSEVVDHLIDPLLSGIYAGNMDRLSLQATFPRFFEVERQYRSLILGMREERPSSGGGRKKAGFYSLTKGLQSFVEGIENHLDEDAVHKNSGLQSIRKKEGQYELAFSDGSTSLFDRVIMTTPHDITASLLDSDILKEELASIPATSVATVAMAFDENQLSGDFDGTGFVVSKKSGYTITACTWTHRKWEHAAPPGKALLRCYVGKPGGEDVVEKPDEEIVDIVLKDLNHVMAVEGKPEYFNVTRWRHAMPQYEVGHFEKMERISSHMKEKFPGIYTAGAAFEGVGLPDCISQGEQAVRRMMEQQ
ncbi:protoporphyrinogen oxidase [Salibacterium halotolerans]|uniref:Coproporphyrinogen III oxidase n=1 Tax=Salibacterium halotolerans TaxID=1884432 RepID=A0A1I5UG61_9BACI|nr:protoporphyrinogen oxidase [Salibacterium halotolerans]SFP94255.1 oxygen-dependent protoporphyrinogen oxidase [Salibacterium halotolerans]